MDLGVKLRGLLLRYPGNFFGKARFFLFVGLLADIAKNARGHSYVRYTALKRVMDQSVLADAHVAILVVLDRASLGRLGQTCLPVSCAWHMSEKYTTWQGGLPLRPKLRHQQ